MSDRPRNLSLPASIVPILYRFTVKDADGYTIATGTGYALASEVDQRCSEIVSAAAEDGYPDATVTADPA
jgi:hypothetical protein